MGYVGKEPRKDGGSLTLGATLDTNGNEIVLDADADTSITADTDDQIDIRIAGADDFQFTANTFTAQSGSTIAAQALTATTITATGDISLDGGSFVFNESSANKDFRVESNGDANMLFVDGGENRVGIGTGTPSVDLHIVQASDEGTPTFAGATHFAVQATASSSDNVNMSLISGTAGTSRIMFGDKDDEDIGKIEYGNDDNDFIFYTNTSRRMLIGSTGVVKFGSFSGTQKINFDMPSQIFTFLSDATAATLRDSSSAQAVAIDGNNGLVSAVAGGASGKFGRNSNDGNVVEFRQAGTLEGAVSISGSTTSYNAFTGSHWSRLTDNSKPTILRGTVMETLDEMCDWYHLEFTIPEVKYVDGDDIPEDKKIGDVQTEKIEMKTDGYEKPSDVNVGDTVKHTHEGVEYDAKVAKDGDVKHVKSKISDTAECTNVYGVFMDWDNDDDTVNDMYVNALGTSLVRIHKDQTVAKGDLITSNGDGTAKKQNDDIIRSKTIGKVLTNIKQETYSDGSYTVPCALYCG